VSLEKAETARCHLAQARSDVLAEACAKEIAGYEIQCEVAIALMRSSAQDVDLSTMSTLATTAGRWSRRVEALGWMRDRALRGVSSSERQELRRIGRALVVRSEHRWVQPAAFALLATIAPEEASAVLRERLDRPAEGDDFLVRERMVDVAGRMPNGELAEVVTQASFDPSEHVRMTAAAVERREEFLASTAQSDRSHRVRAVALKALVRQASDRASRTLYGVLEHDTHPFVLETSLALLIELAKDGGVSAPEWAAARVAAACSRADIEPRVRARLVELLGVLEVTANPQLAVAHDTLAKVLDEVPVEGGLRLQGPALEALTERVLARVLPVLARKDFGLAADRKGDEIVVYRSEPRRTALWRVLFEILHPTPAKRQGQVHTWARKPRGSLRAPPGGLAELTATTVPGERVLIEDLGDWGRHLPMVDDFLEATSVRAAPVTIASPHGMTTIAPAADLGKRVGGWARITWLYESLSTLRRRSLETNEPSARDAFVREMERVSGAKVTFASHTYGPERRTIPAPPGAPPAALAIAPLGALASSTFGDFWSYATSLDGNRLPEVAAYAAVVLFGIVARGMFVRRAIDRDRSAIPLVVGGWGTRGKSGTERLKAGLFQGLGYECLVKTTGCEAMFIHAIPGVPAREIFLYRPYDKATVWEQRDVLSLAARFNVRVFLWECMALQPDLVNLLQMQWMRDDYSTITNAYPDHEDVQGPTGYDVAECISEFVPTGGHLFTTEDQMLPILKQRAKERRTTLHEVGSADSELISEEILDRFPYQEHPRNIALVGALARAMGVPRSVALVEMADNVVPDLGVLKTYPAIEHEGRRLAFTNGMSANERTGALGNWKRSGFDTHDPEVEPARWIVTVVNNRADRVARSEVFARFLVEDVAAHRHVLIGTNVKGLLRFIDEALERHLDRISPTANLGGTPDEQRAVAGTRLERALSMLKIRATTAASVERECAALGWTAPPRMQLEQLLRPSSPDETHADAKRSVVSQLAIVDATSLPFLVETIVRRRVAQAVWWSLEASPPERFEQTFRAAYRAIFRDTLLPLMDPTMTGDALIDRIARSIPPGATGSIMGLQNIKGTGLDFVYRWVSIDAVEKMLARLRSDDRAVREQGLRELAMHGDYGLFDARRAHAHLVARARTDADSGLPYATVIDGLERRVSEKERSATARAENSAGDFVRRIVGKTFDYLDSVRRQKMAKVVVDSLVAGRISHSDAATRMRAIVARQKGAWMRRKG
jgi:poly-gamma-glutamate synthase PgsB/CapB